MLIITASELFLSRPKSQSFLNNKWPNNSKLFDLEKIQGIPKKKRSNGKESTQVSTAYNASITPNL